MVLPTQKAERADVELDPEVTGAKMPSSVRARYSVVRVLEVPDGVVGVSSCRSKQVIRIVYESGAVPADGVTDRSGIQKALSHARSLLARRSDIEA
jgi:hypothetical protein